MRHLNEELRHRLDPITYWRSPEIYSASSLTDFLDNRSYAKPTRKILWPGRTWNGQALIHIPHVHFTYVDWIVDYGKLRDAVSDYDVGIGKLPVTKKEGLRSLPELYNTWLEYHIKEDFSSLIGFDENGPALEFDESVGVPFFRRTPELVRI
ncbi:MAG: hypothetical protein HYX24_05410 [Candidatus Aenigmarchaeota archaeon]|nr:hypothetical protein [Candidatus Aenigmarchaeota archaeon]